MDADYSFHVKTIKTYARVFLTLIILAIGSVLYKSLLVFEIPWRPRVKGMPGKAKTTKNW